MYACVELSLVTVLTESTSASLLDPSSAVRISMDDLAGFGGGSGSSLVRGLKNFFIDAIY